jgi:hypothetical protein
VIVVSDHGLANVERGYRLTVEDQVGPSDMDFILVLNEGVVFQPRSLSNKVPRGMHGYHPELPSQKGVFAAFGAPLPGDAYPRTNVKVAAVLMGIL